MRIVLDYGGTIVDRIDDYEYSRTLGDGVVRHPAFVAYSAFERGIIQTEDEYLRALSALSGDTVEDCRAYLEERKEAVSLPDDRERVLRELADDHSLALFTDQVRVWIDGFLGRLGIADLFDDTVVSSDIGRVKPHPEGYSRLCDGYDDAVMVGDEVSTDLVMAERFGMETVWVKNSHGDGTAHGEPDHTVDDLTEVPEVL
ncbi:MAG: putative hydrolase of the HAD superfamily [Methanobacteriota archaeon]|jgi:putative hydrolase of the HAD superfamily|uniref:HAD family hydrolase n=1 Tax=Halorutilus salinus TaxID=2487751 RepID=A0A9Q4GJ47_9EURY|nr:HAD family hydrolase [Halorutilus salinus]MCX2819548.1 HAD family hydrolase [Halorutilus salinus]